MPSPAGSPLHVSGIGSTTLTTPSFTPADGEIIVVAGCCSDGATTMGAPSGGSLSFGSPKAQETPGGFAGTVVIYAVQVGTSPGSMTISSTPSGSAPHSITVSRWMNATLAGTPASGAAQGGSGSANTSLTTTGPDSVIVWAACDLQSVDPATRAYLASATEDGLYDGHGGANGVHYYAHQSAATAGSKNFGLSAPGGMQYVIAGMEILDVPVTWTFGYDVIIG